MSSNTTPRRHTQDILAGPVHQSVASPNKHIEMPGEGGGRGKGLLYTLITKIRLENGGGGGGRGVEMSSHNTFYFHCTFIYRSY